MVVYHFAATYGVMFALAWKHPKIFGRYTDWMRLQILVWYSCCHDEPWTKDLIWVNAVGCFLSAHIVYAVTRYELLDYIASDFFRRVIGYDHSDRLIHFIMDFMVQGLPVLFAYGLLNERPRPPPVPFIWLMTSLPHMCYGVLLTGEWEMTSFYGVSMQDFNRSEAWVAVSVLIGHFTAYSLLLFIV